MFSLPDDSGFVQNMENSGPENSHTSQCSEVPCLSSEASGTVFEQTFYTGDISQQWILEGGPGFPPSNDVGEPIWEGFWPSASILEASGSSIHGYHGTRNVENQGPITANYMEPGSEIASLQDAEPTLFLSILDNRNLNESPTASSGNIVRPRNRASPSYRQREQNDSGRFQCRWEGCNYSGTFLAESSLWRHIRAQHLQPDRFKCPDPSCRKAFTRKDKILENYRMMHDKS